MKPTEQIAEELWDKYSEYIDDNSSSFERVAGTSVIATRSEFKKAVAEAISQMQPELVTLKRHDQQLRSWIDSMTAELKVLRTALKDVKEFSNDDELSEWLTEQDYLPQPPTK